MRCSLGIAATARIDFSWPVVVTGCPTCSGRALVVPAGRYARQHSPGFFRGHWLYVLLEEEQAHDAGQAGIEEV